MGQRQFCNVCCKCKAGILCRNLGYLLMSHVPKTLILGSRSSGHSWMASYEWKGDAPATSLTLDSSVKDPPASHRAQIHIFLWESLAESEDPASKVNWREGKDWKLVPSCPRRSHAGLCSAEHTLRWQSSWRQTWGRGSGVGGEILNWIVS